MELEEVFFVNIWITFLCNFSCRYCYVKPYYRNMSMDTKTANQVINFIKNNIKKEQKLIINFHGGEPTLNFDIVKYIINKIDCEIDNTVSYGITTNGSLLTDNMIQFLTQKCDYNLSVSIDGKKETHDYNRRARDNKSYYELIISNAKKMLALKPDTRIRMTFDRHNVKNLYENILYFLESGFKYVVPAADIFSKDWAEDDFYELKLQMKKIKALEKIYGVQIELTADNVECISNCTAGNDYYSIDPYGKIFPCTFLVGCDEWIIGDCENGLVKEKLERITSITSKKVDECLECSVYKCCIGPRCVFTNYVTNGNYYTPNIVECNMMNLKLQINNYI